MGALAKNIYLKLAPNTGLENFLFSNHAEVEGLQQFLKQQNMNENIELAFHSMQREIAVQKLCKSVLDTPPDLADNPNGAYETTCLFCGATEHRRGNGQIWASMHELNHEADCAYLLAKNLSTKMNRQHHKF